MVGKERDLLGALRHFFLAYTYGVLQAGVSAGELVIAPFVPFEERFIEGIDDGEDSAVEGKNSTIDSLISTFGSIVNCFERIPSAVKECCYVPIVESEEEAFRQLMKGFRDLAPEFENFYVKVEEYVHSEKVSVLNL